MPSNNNQKVQTAAARLAKMPMVHSACTKLSVLYIDTKSTHPKLRSVCEVLESSVTAIGSAACDRVSPVIHKLEPQISIANDVACKSLDWLETVFPVLHTPTQQIVATAKNKMHEIQAVVNIAASGTMDCVQHTVTWLIGRIQQADDQSLVERTISVASAGLDSTLIMSEALMDRVFPPTEEEEEEEEAAHLLEGFEAATLRSSYSVRLVSLAAKLYRRTYHMVGSKMQSVQVIENLCRSPGLVQDLQTNWVTLAWSIHGLPRYVQHQLVSVCFFMSQMYNLRCPPSKHQSNQDESCSNAAETTSSHKDVVQVPQQPTPISRKRRPTKIVFDRGCNVKGCVRR
ncbi:perilipin-2-like isoform X1 [Micropterus salmoides]|uniref:perilipin-2-like isoform X1 n=1 Tax=Micropterus salmoides TaxID=27706 RepID=UPI0018EA42CD|nr:perilipin-2-like isoform X1 [Micropterus salmoides]XP_038569274.1 perilipin-2-like isoform X1 [Micropterus salmoides]